MPVLLWSGFGEYWALYHKVTFDGPNKLIYVNEGVTELNVRDDIYSDWKEWVQYEDNAKYEQALRTVGGDPISEGVFLGQTFFLTNGWRIRTWEGNHRLIVNGNLYTNEGDNVFVPTLQPWNIEIAMTRSNLVDLIQPVVNVEGIEIPTAPEIATEVWNKSTVDHQLVGSFGKLAFDTYSAVTSNGTAIVGIPAAVWERLLTSHNTPGTFGNRVQALPLSVPTPPTPEEIKDAVWDAALTDHVTAGTFGYQVQNPPTGPSAGDIANAVWSDPDAATTISSNVPTTTEISTEVWSDPAAASTIAGAVPSTATIAGAVWDEAYAAHNIAGTFGYLAQQMATDANNAHLVAMQAVSLMEVLLKYERNRTMIDKNAFTLTVYDDDGVTPIRVFNLKNSLGAPSVTEVTERVPA